MLRSCGAQWLNPAPLRFARTQRRQSRDGCRTFPCPHPKRLRAGFWSGLHQRSPLAAVWMSGFFCQGRPSGPSTTTIAVLSLKYMTSSRDLGALSLLSARLRTSASSALTTVDGAEEKGYERMPQLDESVAAHLCHPGHRLEAKPVTPSQPCRTRRARWTLLRCSGQAAVRRSTLWQVLQVSQAQAPLWLRRVREPEILHSQGAESATDLDFASQPQTTAQAIGRSMASW